MTRKPILPDQTLLRKFFCRTGTDRPYDAGPTDELSQRAQRSFTATTACEVGWTSTLLQ